MNSDEPRNALPQSWTCVRLEDIGTWQGGATPSKSNDAFWENGDIPWISPKDVKSDRIRATEDHVTLAALSSTALRLLKPGSLVLVVRSGILRRTLPVAITEVHAALNQDLKGVTPYTGIDAAYLYYALRHLEQEILQDCSKDGTTVSSIDFSKLLHFKIPLAPTAEQQRIVAALETQLTRLDAAVAALKRARANLKRYRAAVLKAACEGRLVPTEAELARAEGREYESGEELVERILARRPSLRDVRPLSIRARAAPGSRTEGDSSSEPFEVSSTSLLPLGWTWVRVKQVGDVKLGRQRAPQHHAGSNMRPYLRVANVFEGRIDLSDLMEMNFTPTEFEQYRLQYGDILLNEGQSIELVGRPAMYRGEMDGVCFQNTLLRFRAFDEIDRDYALIVFLAYLHGGTFRRIARWTVNIAHLGANRFANMVFPLPPLAEQSRIVAEVERRLSVVEELEKTIDASLKRAERLRQAILARAFAGKLVPQDPTDEPASVLLERIRAERREAGASRGRRQRSRHSATQAPLPL